MYNKDLVKKCQNRLFDMALVVRNILEEANIPYFITYGTLLGAVRHKGFIPWDDDFDYYLFADRYDDALDALRKNLPDDMFLEWYDSEPNYFHAWARVKDLNSVVENTMFPQDMAYTHRGLNVDLYITNLIKESEHQQYLAKQHFAYIERRRKLNLISEEDHQNRLRKIKPVLEVSQENKSQEDKSERQIYAFMSVYNGDFLYPEELFPLKKYEFEGEQFCVPNNADIFLKRCYGDYMQFPPEEKRMPHNENVKFLK